MIYAVCLLANSDIAAKLFNLALAIATSLALYGFCKRYLSSRVGVVAATTYAMMNYLDTGKRGWLWISALLAGFSLGVKHSAALWLLLIGVMYLIESL